MSRNEIVKYAKSPEIMQRFTELIGNETTAGIYIYGVIAAVANSDALQKCEPQSIMKAAADAAALGMSVDPNIKEAYLVPYKDQASLIVGWRGLRNMAYNTGKVRYLNVGALYEGQEWVQDQLTGVSEIKGHKTGKEAIGYFAYMETKDHRIHTHYMTNEEIQDHKKKYAKGYNREGSAWNTDFEKMAKKTVLRQVLSMWAELSPVMLAVDNFEISDVGDDFPDPDHVTIVESPVKSMTEKEILEELGFSQNDSVEDGEYVEQPEPQPQPQPAPKPKTKQNPQQASDPDTSYPGSQSEYYAWIMQGEVPYIGVQDAKLALDRANGELDIAWETVLAKSKDRVGREKNKKKDQPDLL